ncbi:hypothetical protein GCM10022217_20300 [Chryseobacterium ginsenosidimutans]|uniref:hypothetical protein n=1 Tax=Chryseobacterium ginsenosidimutans TaxID=687846 RepID=UPI0031D96805
MQKIIRRGEWKYSGNTYLPILLVEQDWDHFYEQGYNNLLPHINKKGLEYYLYFGRYFINEYGNISSHSSSRPFLSIEEAIEYAERNIEKLHWLIEENK